ncbi:uncharacterized protein LOC129211669 [Grus americana]|uniref:uncharacterized protein LOC129211669 n=1 Tax=Grus americana TaxID=9117 RepID=UPI002407C32C|nr:uncharacterized protein LOC129211669 [Grus americana]
MSNTHLPAPLRPSGRPGFVLCAGATLHLTEMFPFSSIQDETGRLLDFLPLEEGGKELIFPCRDKLVLVFLHLMALWADECGSLPPQALALEEGRVELGRRADTPSGKVHRPLALLAGCPGAFPGPPSGSPHAPASPPALSPQAGPRAPRGPSPPAAPAPRAPSSARRGAGPAAAGCPSPPGASPPGPEAPLPRFDPRPRSACTARLRRRRARAGPRPHPPHTPALPAPRPSPARRQADARRSHPRSHTHRGDAALKGPAAARGPAHVRPLSSLRPQPRALPPRPGDASAGAGRAGRVEPSGCQPASRQV